MKKAPFVDDDLSSEQVWAGCSHDDKSAASSARHKAKMTSHPRRWKMHSSRIDTVLSVRGDVTPAGYVIDGIAIATTILRSGPDVIHTVATFERDRVDELLTLLGGNAPVLAALPAVSQSTLCQALRSIFSGPDVDIRYKPSGDLADCRAMLAIDKLMFSIDPSKLRVDEEGRLRRRHLTEFAGAFSLLYQVASSDAFEGRFT